MNKRIIFFAALLSCFLLTFVIKASPQNKKALTLNDIQVIGTHNSYHIAAKEPQRSMMQEYDEDVFEALNYTHPPLDDQLENGIRSFELDIMFQEDGFVTVHVPEYDFETNCPTFVDCLRTMRNWSDNNSNHLPILVLVQVKDSFSIPLNSTTLYETTEEILARMDQELISIMGWEKLITPDQVRGDAKTLEAAVLSKGWPPLDENRGKFIFALHDSMEKMDLYAEGRPSLQGRPMFATTREGRPDAAVLVINNPESPDIPRLVKAGYFVRTRADSGVREARADDYSRFENAMQSGANVIHTDFPLSQPHPETGYEVHFPNKKLFRCNPVTTGGYCRDDMLE